MKQKRGARKFLDILNSKPVIGALIFIMLSLVSVLAGNVIVNEGNINIENNLNSSGVLFVNSTSGKVGIGTSSPAYALEISQTAKALNVSGLLYVNSSNVGIGIASLSEKLEVAGRIKDLTGYVAPVGTIIMYGGSTAPTGWLLCNNSAVSRTTYADLFAVIGTTFGTGDGSTTFNLPDMRGIFPRGAGTSAKLSNAAGTAFAGTLGTYQNDKTQEHLHYQGFAADGVAGRYNIATGLAANNYAERDEQENPTTDTDAAKTSTEMAYGFMGNPRTGYETNPANLGLTFIIKY